MLAIRQSVGTTPELSDWLNMKVSIPDISLHVSFITRGDISSAPSDFLGSKPERSLQTPGEVTSNVGMSGQSEGKITGIVLSSSVVTRSSATAKRTALQ